MSDPYKRTKSGTLTFKDGTPATRKSIEKKKKKQKQKHKKKKDIEDDESQPSIVDVAATTTTNNNNNNNNNEAGKIYSINVAKNMKYGELFPVKTKKFGYDPKSNTFKTVEDALDDRIKKKADRYCK